MNKKLSILFIIFLSTTTHLQAAEQCREGLLWYITRLSANLQEDPSSAIADNNPQAFSALLSRFRNMQIDKENKRLKQNYLNLLIKYGDLGLRTPHERNQDRLVSANAGRYVQETAALLKEILLNAIERIDNIDPVTLATTITMYKYYRQFERQNPLANQHIEGLEQNLSEYTITFHMQQVTLNQNQRS